AAQPEEGGYYVPVVVSPPREDTDKKGAKALVFNAVFHTSVKGRVTRDEAFKAFVVGRLAPRRVQIPSALFAAACSAAPDAPDALNISGTVAAGKAKGKKLIEEVEGPPNSKGILKGEVKNGSAKAKTKTNSWAKAGTRIKITIAVPLLPRRVLLAVPGLYGLDVPLDAPDAELTGALGLKRAGDLDVEGARAEW
ncbi:hypothetical protein FIBSPDRAFT_850924, partial [Athelia psychrophila]